MRILVDCTGINIHQRLLTGIPRVVQNYLRHGQTFGAERGITVLPVRMHDGNILLQPASGSFPHPPAAPADLPRRRLWPLAVRAAQGVALGIGYALYALPWLGFQARRLMLDKERGEALNRRCNSFGQILLEPSDMLGRAYHSRIRIEPRPDDILFCPAYWHDVPPAHYAALRGRVGHMAVLIHDVIPASHPQYYRAPWRDEFRKNVARALVTFDSVLTISGYTAQMLHRLFPAEAAQANIAVCHNGLEPLETAPDRRPRHADVFEGDLAPFLMVGTIEPKKGHIMVLRALERLWNEGLVTRKLVIIGRTGWMYDEIVAALRRTRHADRVVWLRDADDAALAHAYRHAHLLIHASEVEGFGLPMIECATAGTPVLARRTEIAEEVLGSAGIYFDAEVPDSLHDAILAMEDATAHAARRAAVAGFHWPEWREVAPALFATLCARARDGAPLPPVISPAPRR